ncbi:MAG: TOPRIM nucleotidyl transferase/hydrolase domain-containing protein [Rhodoglobus sp.]
MDEVARFRTAVTASADTAALDPAVATLAGGIRIAVLVEGESDRVAIETLAERLGRNLASEAVCVMALGGVTSIGRFLDVLVPAGVALAGMCDAGEERYFERGLERAGLGFGLSRTTMETLGFFACERDLEDELFRAIGLDGVEFAIEGEGDLRALRSLQNQPFQRTRTREQQLRRFMGSIGGRKSQYARALVQALDLGRVPRPLALLLEHVRPSAR